MISTEGKKLMRTVSQGKKYRTGGGKGTPKKLVQFIKVYFCKRILYS